jgi:hypothetical protein
VQLDVLALADVVFAPVVGELVDVGVERAGQTSATMSRML